MASENNEIRDVNDKINYAKIGLNTDSIVTDVKGGYVTDALNAVIENYDGHSITYSNEAGSVFCFTCPSGYKVVGKVYIPQLSEVVYFLTNPTTNHSIVGYVLDNNCTFNSILDDTFPDSNLLNFNINYPILKIEVKTTNCSTQLYFTDAYNKRRYIDLNNLPWATTLIGGIPTPIVGQINTNLMLVQPNFSIMTITPTVVNIGGNLIEGTYQFAACYADVYSNQLTGFYNVTNPVSIFNNGVISPNFNDPTNKSISLSLDKLDTTGLYDYFNLAVIKTINGISTVDFVGTFNIQQEIFTFTYTGNEQSNANIKLSITDIMEQFEYYDTASMLCQVDNQLVWGGLTKEDPYNYQSIWTKVNVGWGTWQVPYTELEDYSNGINSAILKGYMRDEVYPLEGCFILANGMETPRCHIPGRVVLPSDLVPISTSNLDVEGVVDSNCTPPPSTVPTWQVYNTGSVTGFDPEYNSGYSCPQPYQIGQMGYWQSIYNYPNNPIIWGTLANTPIRHHRFPDSLVTHIHDQNPYPIGSSQYNSYVHNIYPIGFKIDINSIYQAIQSSSILTSDQKNQIVGFKIMRGDRDGNEGIIAKGFLYNCGHYTKYGEDFFYANYPFNDVNPDPFISSTPVSNKSGANINNLLNDFQQNRYTFHSPDTHFNQPSGILGSYLKLETAENGTAKSHFVQVLENAKEKLRTTAALDIAVAIAALSMIGIQLNSDEALTIGTLDTSTTSVGLTPTFDIQNFLPTYNTILDLLDKLSPWVNYGWQYNGIGYYGNYTPVQNNGSKIRNILYGGYITSGVNGTFGDTYPINNTNRESSVYLSISSKLPYAGNDNSRKTASEAGVCHSSSAFYSDISSYYASIKNYLPGQYGEIYSYVPVDTGFYSTFFDDNNDLITNIPTIFGGDIFINRFALKIKQPFYNIDSVNKVNGTDVDYNQDPDPTNPAQDYTNTGNIGYPIWYYSTDNVTVDVENAFSPGLTNLTDLFTTAGGITVLIATGGLAFVGVMLQIVYEFLTGPLLHDLGLKVTNLDCNNYTSTDQLWETGQAYLYAYGIPYYFCESQVNVDMRLATNIKEGNFYPQVGTDIPDDWLQQTNTPIAFDNTYNYNKTYSKENKETYFSLLRPGWEPNQTCYINYNNRAIWSDTSSLEETKNNWLVYRPANLHDFPKIYGNMQAMDYLENREVLVRFDNHSQIYNALSTVVTSGLTAALGTGILFSGTPLDIKPTDSGFAGTMNKFILNTEEGHIFVDARRGQVLLLKGNSVENLADPKYLNSKLLFNNLQFQILDYFPNLNVDNNFNGIGLTGVYDDFYHRFILTKIDYTPLSDEVQYDSTIGFYINGTPIPTQTSEIITNVPGIPTCCPSGYTYGRLPTDPNIITCYFPGFYKLTATPFPCETTTEVQTIVTQGYTPKIPISLGDPRYFCNKSFTVSFNFLTNSWVSPHSYYPNFYIEYEDYFQAGLNIDPNNSNNCSIWDHNSTFTLFNNFFGVSYPYILEIPYSFAAENEILQSIKDYLTVLQYSSWDQFIEIDTPIVYYDQVVVFNNQQNSGIRDIVIKSINNKQQLRQYPEYNTSNISILVAKDQNYFNYNMIWDVVKSFATPNWLDSCNPSQGIKTINQSNMNYTNQSYKKYPIRGKDAKVRSILNKTNYKFLSRYTIVKSKKDY